MSTRAILFPYADLTFTAHAERGKNISRSGESDEGKKEEIEKWYGRETRTVKEEGKRLGGEQERGGGEAAGGRRRRQRRRRRGRRSVGGGGGGHPRGNTRQAHPAGTGTHILRCDFKNGGLPLCPLHTGTQTHPTGAAAMDKEYGLRSR